MFQFLTQSGYIMRRYPLVPVTIDDTSSLFLLFLDHCVPTHRKTVRKPFLHYSLMPVIWDVVDSLASACRHSRCRQFDMSTSLCPGNSSGGIEHRVPVEEGTASTDHLISSPCLDISVSQVVHDAARGSGCRLQPLPRVIDKVTTPCGCGSHSRWSKSRRWNWASPAVRRW
jgi:hypothetical protein